MIRSRSTFAQIEAAAASYERAIELQPERAGLLGLLAAFHVRHGDREAAETAFRQALVAQPGYPEAYSALAGLYRAQGEFDRAEEGGQNAMRISIEWSRIQPEPDRWDEDALDHYRDIIRGMVEVFCSGGHRDMLRGLAGIAAPARAWREDRRGYVALGMKAWKRPHLRRAFGRETPLKFAPRMPSGGGDRIPVVWGMARAPEGALELAQLGLQRSAALLELRQLHANGLQLRLASFRLGQSQCFVGPLDLGRVFFEGGLGYFSFGDVG